MYINIEITKKISILLFYFRFYFIFKKLQDFNEFRRILVSIYFKHSRNYKQYIFAANGF